MAGSSKKLVAILSFAFVLRVIFFLAAHPWTDDMQRRIIRSDAIGYQELALNILDKCEFKLDGERNSFRTPGYPLFIAGIYGIFGAKPYIVLIFQILLNILSIYLLYSIVEKLFNASAAFWAAIFFAIDPITILYTCEMFSETLLVFMLLLALWILLLALDSKSWRLFVLSGLIFGYSALTKPIAIYIFLIVVAIIFVSNGLSLKQKTFSSIAFIIGFSIFVLPWMYRNYKAFERFSFCSLPLYNFVFYNIPFTEHDWTGANVNQIRHKLTNKVRQDGGIISYWDANNAKQFDNYSIYKQILLDYVKKNPAKFLITHVKNSFYVYLNVGTKGFMSMLHYKEVELPQMAAEDLKHNITNIFRYKSKKEISLIFIFAAFLGTIYLLSLVGAYTLLKEKKYFELLLIVLFMAYFTFLLGANGNAARFRLPIVPFYSALAGQGFVLIINKIKGMKRQKTVSEATIQ